MIGIGKMKMRRRQELIVENEKQTKKTKFVLGFGLRSLLQGLKTKPGRVNSPEVTQSQP